METKFYFASFLLATFLFFPAKASGITECDTTWNNCNAVVVVNDKHLQHLTFKETLKTILRANQFDANNSVTDTQIDKFIATLLSSFNDEYFDNNGFTLENFPLPEISDNIDPSDLYEPTSKYFLVPTAVFNRFDLATDNFVDCGEHRIVYSFRYPNSTPVVKRFFLIFEARISNKNGGTKQQNEEALIADGCRDIAEFWFNLGTQPSVADELKRFFYVGIDGRAPAMSHTNFAEGMGQVRGNVSIKRKGRKKAIWQLREWRIRGIGGGELKFQSDTLKDSTLKGLFQNPSIYFTEEFEELKRHFHVVFKRSYLPALIDPKGTPVTRSVGSGTRDAEWIINNLGVPKLSAPYDKFNTVFENSSDRLASVGLRASQFSKLLDDTSAQISGVLKHGQKLNFSDLIRRAEAVSCAGCHQHTQNNRIGVFPLDPENPVSWPRNGRFIHVSEPTNPVQNRLSSALREKFLKFRYEVLQSFLNKVGFRDDINIARFNEIYEKYDTVRNEIREFQRTDSTRELSSNLDELDKNTLEFRSLLHSLPGELVHNRRTH